jgi:hypothetical protein
MRSAILIVATLVLSVGCGASLDPDQPALTGRITSIWSNPPDTWYPGEISIAGTSVGAIRAYIFDWLPITVRAHDGTTRKGTFEDFAVDDIVIAWFDEDGAVLRSGVPVYPVSRIEIRR